MEKATGRAKVPDTHDGSCLLLNTSRKRHVYASRPLSWRTHFCEAAGSLRTTIIDLIRKREDIDVSVGGSGAIRLPDAIKRLFLKR